MGMKSVPIATVVRHKFGTGPFDKIWLNKDCCGLVCAGITYMLHFYGCYAVTTILLPPWMSYVTTTTSYNENSGAASSEEYRYLNFWGKFHSFFFVLVAILAVASHFKAMTTDPGSVPPDAEPVPMHDPLQLNSAGAGSHVDDQNILTEPLTKPKRSGPKRICRRCNSYKPDRAHHCSICKRCIIKMDHHCPWVNNCVGIGNHKYFLLFIFYTCLSCTYAMGLVIARFVSCIGKIEHHEPCLDAPTHLLGVIGLCVESMLFGMFTCCMIIDQWDVVLTNVTHIDRLKGDIKNEDVDGNSGIHEVFGAGIGHDKGKKRGKGNGNGGNFRPDWLSPFANVCFPENMKDEIMGFCRPCGFSVGGIGIGIGGSLGGSMKKNKDKVEDDHIALTLTSAASNLSSSSVSGSRKNVAEIV
jgi:hypothetical protein